MKSLNWLAPVKYIPWWQENSELLEASHVYLMPVLFFSHASTYIHRCIKTGCSKIFRDKIDVQSPSLTLSNLSALSTSPCPADSQAHWEHFVFILKSRHIWAESLKCCLHYKKGHGRNFIFSGKQEFPKNSSSTINSKNPSLLSMIWVFKDNNSYSFFLSWHFPPWVQLFSNSRSIKTKPHV